MNIFLDEYYKCKDGEITVSKQKINCKYWNIDTPCNATCSLGLFSSPTIHNCYNCKKREVVKDVPVVEEPSFLQKAVSYVKAETSQILQGKVSEEVYTKRKEICLACDHKTNPHTNTEPIGWCKGGCGCQVGNPRAALSEKLYMPTISCPLNKFAYEKGEGFNLNDAVDSLKGMKTAISETLKDTPKD